MFEKAARLKLRFETTKGSLTAEDLFDLPLTSTKGSSLDSVAIALNRTLKETSTESFVNISPKSDEITQLRFDIIKHVIDLKKAENLAASDARERKEKKDRILAILARKQDEKLEGASEDDLRKELESL